MLNRIHLLSCLVISAILEVWLPELTQFSPGRSCEADRHCQTGGLVIHGAVGRYVGAQAQATLCFSHVQSGSELHGLVIPHAS